MKPWAFWEKYLITEMYLQKDHWHLLWVNAYGFQ